MSSIKDVAKLAGVSISTASNALNRTRYVRAETIEKVEYAAKVLNYSVDPIARSMKSNKTAQIGVITEDICGVFYPYVVRGINSVAIEKGYNILISDTQGTYGNEDAVNREKAIFERLINARVDGIIFVSAVSEKNMDQVRDVESRSIWALTGKLHFPRRLRWKMIRLKSRDNARTPMRIPSQAAGPYPMTGPR